MIKFLGNIHVVLRIDCHQLDKGKVIMTELKYYAELIAGAAIWWMSYHATRSARCQNIMPGTYWVGIIIRRLTSGWHNLWHVLTSTHLLYPKMANFGKSAHLYVPKQKFFHELTSSNNDGIAFRFKRLPPLCGFSAFFKFSTFFSHFKAVFQLVGTPRPNWNEQRSIVYGSTTLNFLWPIQSYTHHISWHQVEMLKNVLYGAPYCTVIATLLYPVSLCETRQQ